jgi:hypothetical protein
MSKDDFFATVTPALMTFLGVAVPALLAWLGAILKSWTAKQKEATDRQALHMALETGVGAAVVRDHHATSQEKARYAVDYARKSVPDAIANLNPSTEVMEKIALSKVATVETQGAKSP